MHLCEIGLCACVAVVLYPYVIYPLLLAILARLRPRPVKRGDLHPRSVSIIISAHNEQERIERRLSELIGLLERSVVDGEILVVDDASSDETAARIRLYTKPYVQILEMDERVGKADAISQAAALASHDILAFADCRQTWAEDALIRLLENFADPEVGAVSGDLVVRTGSSVMEGIGLYWRYEKWLRCQESLVGSQVGVSGSISACRRELFTPIPPGTLLDDVYWPLCVVMKGYRVVHDSRAHAYDELPERIGDEFRRKVRTLAGNFQLLARLPGALIPSRNPVWGQLVSHKLARLAVPWALLALLVFSALGEGWLCRTALLAQGLGYGLGLVGLCTSRLGRVGSVVASFLVLNTAAWVAFWVWITGRAGQSWQKVSYYKRDRCSADPLRQTASS